MLQTVPLFGLGTGTKSVNVSAQSRTNLYAETSQEPDKTPIAYYPRPGLTRAAVGLAQGSLTGLVSGPARGALVVSFSFLTTQYATRDVAIVVIGNSIYSGTSTLTATGDNTTPNVANSLMHTNQGAVGVASNGIDAIIVDGAIGYIVNVGGLLTPTPGPIASANFPNGCKTACMLASRYVVPDPAVVGRFRWSGLLDGTSWNALDFATAEFDPDPLTATFSARGELMLFGTKTIEFWQPTGDITIFARIAGTTQQWGTSAAGTIRQIAGTVAFLGRAQGGDRQVVILNGYTPVPISTPDIDSDIANDANPDGAKADVYTLGGHTFYVLNLSTKTWAYDHTTRNWAVWRDSDGGRFAGQYSQAFNNVLILSDYRDERFYTFSPTLYSDDGNTLIREVTSRHIFQSGDLMTCDELVVDMETGVGINSGQGSDPQAMLQVSKDGGHTWGNELWRSIGAQGAYTSRVRWTRLGRSRDFMFRLRITDPVKSVLIGAYARFQ